MNGKLYVIPTPLGKGNLSDVLPEKVKEIVNRLNLFIVENERNARRFIKALCPDKSQAALQIFTFEKDMPPETSDTVIASIFEGESIGLLSEAGMPCIADPGQEIIRVAHEKDVNVIPLVGPSSILLALIASGLNGQSFAFHGYLPIKNDGLKEKIRILEKLSCETDQTQIFIETPYRNNRLLETLLNYGSPNTLLTIATDLTLHTQEIKTRTICSWKDAKPKIHKRPSIFAFQGSSKRFS